MCIYCIATSCRAGEVQENLPVQFLRLDSYVGKKCLGSYGSSEKWRLIYSDELCDSA